MASAAVLVDGPLCGVGGETEGALDRESVSFIPTFCSLGQTKSRPFALTGPHFFYLGLAPLQRGIASFNSLEFLAEL